MSIWRRGQVTNSQLTGQMVLDILDRYHNKGWSQGRLARAFPVSVGQIGRIVRGEAWKELYEKFTGVAPPAGEREYAQALTSTITDEEIHKSEERFRALLGLPAQAQAQAQAQSAQPSAGAPPIPLVEAPEELSAERSEALMRKLSQGEGTAVGAAQEMLNELESNE